MDSANINTKDAIPVNLPVYIETFILDGRDLESEQLEILKGFYERLFDREVVSSNIIFDGMIEDGYVFKPKEKTADPDADMMPDAKEWLKDYISSLTATDSMSQEEQLYIEVLEAMIKALPYMSAQEQITVNFSMDKICLYKKRIVKAPEEEKYALIRKREI